MSRFILYFLEMSDISWISLAFGVVRMVYLATTRRSMVKKQNKPKPFPPPSAMTERVFLFYFFIYYFSLVPHIDFSGPRFRTNQAVVVPL